MTVTVPQTAHDQTSLVPAPAIIAPEFRCKTCKASLPDATWKNCKRCRRSRTESYHRWKKSADLRKATVATPGPSHPPEASSSSAPAPVPNMNPNPPSVDFVVQTASTAPNPTASQAHDPQWRHYNPHPHPTGSSSHTGDRPQTVPAPVMPRFVDVQEYQWLSELYDELSALPPRSTFMGKFSIVREPAADNSARAWMFADQLRVRGLFISKSSESTERNMDCGNAFMLLFSCACQTACRGQVVISADDDKSHPYGILGQRLGVAVLHPSS